jgi:hypothetical protein
MQKATITITGSDQGMTPAFDLAIDAGGFEMSDQWVSDLADHIAANPPEGAETWTNVHPATIQITDDVRTLA